MRTLTTQAFTPSHGRGGNGLRGAKTTQHVCAKFNVMTTRVAACLTAVLVLAFLCPPVAQAVRIKDIANFSGVRDNQLVGYGLIVGLGGTGDSTKSNFTVQSMVNLLENMGVGVDQKKLAPKNVAAVMATVKMPVSAKPGSKLDVTVSSLGDAKSLQGGILLMTPLKGVDGSVYGLAQGVMSRIDRKRQRGNGSEEHRHCSPHSQRLHH